jgi:hypothetical protein
MRQASSEKFDVVFARRKSARRRSKLVPKLSHKNQLFLCRKVFQVRDFLCDHGRIIGLKNGLLKNLTDLLSIRGRVFQLLEIIRVVDLEHEDPAFTEWIGVNQGRI